MKLTTELKVGIIALLSIALLYWGLNFLKGNNIFKNEKVIYSVYNKIDGLTKTRPVTINGLQVGKVKDVYLHPIMDGSLVVAMSLSTDFPIPTNTTAKISSSDLMGTKNIELILGDLPSNVSNGDTLPSSIELSLSEEVNKQVAPLKQKTEKLIGSVDTVLVLISGFLNENTKDNFLSTFNSLKQSFAALQGTIESLEKTTKSSEDDLISTFESVASITKNLAENEEQISGILQNLDQVTDSLAQVNIKETFESLNSSLASADLILKKIDEGDGSLGMLINDPKLYKNLSDASLQLNELLLDLKYNPKRYVHFSMFGGSKDYSDKEIEEIKAAEKKMLLDSINTK